MLQCHSILLIKNGDSGITIQVMEHAPSVMRPRVLRLARGRLVSFRVCLCIEFEVALTDYFI